jgi:crotonobetainyl-CoA:carnitine CoA-transferase CaiB-like acyl-CoA transferase
LRHGLKPWQQTTKEKTMPGPLEGLRILDIATIIAAPSAATLLGDYGADVVKVELPGAGDGARGFPPHKDGKPLWFKVLNRGKRFITLDLRKPEGAALLLSMLPKFDVLIENFRPGTLDTWGLTREALWRANPSLVILRTTGFGQTGPAKDKPGFARVFEALGGLTHITGEADGEPMHTGYPLADNIGGLFGAVGLMAALWRLERNARLRAEGKLPHDAGNLRGEEIDLSLTEATLKLLEFLIVEHDQLGTVRQRSGNANQYSAPAAVFKTKDARWVSLAGSTNALFACNCRAIERTDLIDNPRFASNGTRVQHADELNQVFRLWIGQHNLPEVMASFDAASGTLAPIYDIAQIFADEQMQARGAIASVTDEDFGEIKMANVVPRFTNNPGSIAHSGKAIGADNAEFYKETLGLTDQAQAELKAKGII